MQSSPEYLTHGWQLTFRLLDRVVQSGAASGARTAVFLIPLWFQLTDEEFSGVVKGEREPNRAEPERPQRLMNDWGRNEGVEIIDPLPEM